MAYATTADLANFGFPAAALSAVTAAQQTAALQAASDLADGYLNSQYTLPLTAWGQDLRMHVCAIATFTILTAVRGYNPDGPDALIRLRYEDALAWLEKIARGLVAPVNIIDSTPTVADGAPRVTSGTAGNTSLGGPNPVGYALNRRNW